MRSKNKVKKWILCLLAACLMACSSCAPETRFSNTPAMGTGLAPSLTEANAGSSSQSVTEEVEPTAETASSPTTSAASKATTGAGASAGATTSSSTTQAATAVQPAVTDAREFRGAWLTYMDLSFQGKTEAQFQAKIDEMYDALLDMGFNAVVAHVRPFADSYYPSQYFPFSKYLTGTQGKDPGYDPLEYMVSAAKKRGLEFHAWLNPFRVLAGSTDLNMLSKNHPARLWRTDQDTGNDEWAVNANGGIYLNPGIPEVQKLIIDGVREIVENYDVDGVHIDDYFYPTTDEAFDRKAYEAYQKKAGAGAMSLGDWRRANVSGLVAGIYRAVKQINANVVFGVSPAANNLTNFEKLYADIKRWVSSKGYLDYIAPQCYFGFEYDYKTSLQAFDFVSLARYWSELVEEESVQLYYGLGIYKSGETDRNSNEWIENTDIIARQVEHIRGIENASGFIVYSYRELTGSGKSLVQERENLVKLLR